MRTPERCPFCGSEKIVHDLDAFGVVGWSCGSAMSGGEWVGPCYGAYTPAAAAYRQTLAWRKRLSQILAIPLPQCRAPDSVGRSTARWICGRKSIVIYRGLRRWVLACPMFGDVALRRSEARRRLLAKEGD